MKFWNNNWLMIIGLITFGSISPQPRIAIVSLYDPPYAAIGKYGHLSKKAYAQKHGYDFIGYTVSLDPSRPTSWSKIKAIQQHLEKYDWVFWSDADVVIMNHEIKLEQFIDDNFHLILCPGHEWPINAGNFFLKNCPWSFELLERIYNETKFINSTLWEQDALYHLLFYKEPILQKDVKFMPQRQFNAYIRNQRHPGCYKPGDFLVHFSGAPQREKLMKEAYEWSLKQEGSYVPSTWKPQKSARKRPARRKRRR